MLPEVDLITGRSGRNAGLYLPYTQAGGRDKEQLARASLFRTLQALRPPQKKAALMGGTLLGTRRFLSLAETRSDAYKEAEDRANKERKKSSIEHLGFKYNGLRSDAIASRSADVRYYGPDERGSVSLRILDVAPSQRDGAVCGIASHASAAGSEEEHYHVWKSLYAGRRVNFKHGARVMWGIGATSIFVRMWDAPLAYALQLLDEEFQTDPRKRDRILGRPQGVVVVPTDRRVPGRRDPIKSFPHRERLERSGVILMSASEVPRDIEEAQRDIDRHLARLLSEERREVSAFLMERFKARYSHGTVEMVAASDIADRIGADGTAEDIPIVTSPDDADPEYVFYAHNGSSARFYTPGALNDFVTGREAEAFIADSDEESRFASEEEWSASPLTSKDAYRFGIGSGLPSFGKFPGTSGPRLSAWRDVPYPSGLLDHSDVPHLFWDKEPEEVSIPSSEPSHRDLRVIESPFAGRRVQEVAQDAAA